MAFAERFCPLSHQIIQHPHKAGRTGGIPNEGSSGQGRCMGSAQVPQSSQLWRQNRTRSSNSQGAVLLEGLKGSGK